MIHIFLVLSSINITCKENDHFLVKLSTGLVDNESGLYATSILYPSDICILTVCIYDKFLFRDTLH